MKKTLLYLFGITTLSACQQEDLSQYLHGEKETPIEIIASVDEGAVVTRAVNTQFDNGDKLLLYIQHVQDEDSDGTWQEVSGSGVGPRLAEFTINGNESSAVYAKENSNLIVSPGLYWDDFNNSDNSNTDLRTGGHGLRMLYAYSYFKNVAKPTTGFDEANGVWEWSVQPDQSNSDNAKSSDLLFAGTTAPTSNPIIYNHVAASRGKFEFEYKHAMSKVTVVVKCDEGFAANSDNNFGSAKVIFHNLNTSCQVDAKTEVVTPQATTANIPLCKGTPTSEKKQCDFIAYIAPTVFKKTVNRATDPYIELQNIDGNNYTLNLTDVMLTTAPPTTDPWSTKLTNHTAGTVSNSSSPNYNATNGGLSLPGVNYKLTVTINKQKVEVNATIANWNNVEAEGNGQVAIENDVPITVSAKDINDNLKNIGFDVYQSSTGSSYTKTTTYTFGTDWTRDNEIYWPGTQPSDKLYFRALSKDATTAMTNGNDVLWATTPVEQDVTNGITTAGEAVNPRTGAVPLEFSHAMSKITINLVDVNKDNTSVPESQLDLTDATIQLTGLATGGTLDLHTGKVAATTPAPTDKTFTEDSSSDPKRMGFYAATLNGTATTHDANLTVKDYVITPQDITDNAMIIITLANGTTYKAKLNTCQDNTPAAVNKWEEGKHYVYTITLAKDTIDFRANIKDWDEIRTNTTLTPEWD